jgi:hypothetical protein
LLIAFDGNKSCSLEGWELAYFIVDSSRHPVIDIEISGLLPELKINRALGEVEKLLDRGERFSVIANLAAAEVPDLAARSLFRKFVIDHMKCSNSLSVSCALIIHSVPVTMAVKAVFSSTTPFYPRRVFQSYEDGLLWTQNELKSAEGSG